MVQRFFAHNPGPRVVRGCSQSNGALAGLVAGAGGLSRAVTCSGQGSAAPELCEERVVSAIASLSAFSTADSKLCRTEQSIGQGRCGINQLPSLCTLCMYTLGIRAAGGHESQKLFLRRPRPRLVRSRCRCFCFYRPALSPTVRARPRAHTRPIAGPRVSSPPTAGYYCAGEHSFTPKHISPSISPASR